MGMWIRFTTGKVFDNAFLEIVPYNIFASPKTSMDMSNITSQIRRYTDVLSKLQLIKTAMDGTNFYFI